MNGSLVLDLSQRIARGGESLVPLFWDDDAVLYR